MDVQWLSGKKLKEKHKTGRPLYSSGEQERKLGKSLGSQDQKTRQGKAGWGDGAVL